MYTLDIFLLVIKNAGDEGLQGRTLLQKKIYFLSQLMKVDLGFSAHYYGPYSGLVAGYIERLVGHGFLEETTEVFGTVSQRNIFGEMHRYTYKLTNEAKQLWCEIKDDPELQKWQCALDRIDSHEISHDFNRLSIAAKVHYIVNWRGRRTNAEVRQVAEEYNWKVSKEDIEGVLSFLTELGLVTADGGS